MKYGAILDENNVVQNIIVMDDSQDPSFFGAVLVDETAYIGQTYAPPEPEPTLEERVDSIDAKISEMESAIQRGLSL